MALDHKMLKKKKDHRLSELPQPHSHGGNIIGIL